jgi:hypothetical protein
MRAMATASTGSVLPAPGRPERSREVRLGGTSTTSMPPCEHQTDRGAAAVVARTLDAHSAHRMLGEQLLEVPNPVSVLASSVTTTGGRRRR